MQPAQGDAGSSSVLAVIVVHDRGLDRVEAWPALCAELGVLARHRLGLEHVLIYDNSPSERGRPPTDAMSCTYVHDASNGGTAAAYRHAAALAADLRADWLWLLDHDTRIPPGHLERASAALLEASAGRAPAALLPWVLHGDAVVSPARLTWAGSVRPLQRRPGSAPPRATGALTGIASGCLLRRSAFEALLPLPRELWLDYVDHWIFAQLRARGERLAVIDAVLEHELSIRSVRTLGRTRLHGILDAEARFVKSLPWPARALHPLRLLLRLCRRLPTHPRGALDMLAWLLRYGRQATQPSAVSIDR